MVRRRTVRNYQGNYVTEEKAVSISLDTPGGIIHGLQIGTGKANKLLCLHGWLDNANSFAPIMPLINDAEIVAIDLPGHGLSEHHSEGFPYTIASYAHRVMQVADALGWEQFTLVGHSLGGSIIPVCAVIAADRIKNLVMIDALGPLSETAQQLPQRLKRFHEDFNDPGKHRGRIYASVNLAVEARLLATKMHRSSAQLIVERQLAETEQGFSWRFDRQLRLASPAYYTESQVQEMLKAVQCPVLCIIALEGYIIVRDELMLRLAQIENKTVQKIPGFHHLHMDTPEPVATEINQFLG